MSCGWWRGRRGEWYVVAQFVLGAFIFLGPRTVRGWPLFPRPGSWVWTASGVCLMALGALVLLCALRVLRGGLTPLPYPNPGGTLVEAGPYALVRHPMYTAASLVCLGWSLTARGHPSLLLTVLLDAKSRREERWLVERCAGYADYRKRARWLIPFVY